MANRPDAPDPCCDETDAQSVDENARDLADELRSFGRRRGRKPSPHQRHLLDNVLPPIAVDPEAPLGGVPPGPIWLEIGFGGGEHLVWQAAANPSVTVLGCEPFQDGVVKVLAVVEAEGLTNVRLHADDARPLLRALPPASIARAFVLFPDPWPKRRHAKRRLLNPRTVALLARVMQPGGELRVATDIPDYVRTLLLALTANPDFTWQAARPADWRVQPADWPTTRYQSKALREGRRCYFFRFIRR